MIRAVLCPVNVIRRPLINQIRELASRRRLRYFLLAARGEGLGMGHLGYGQTLPNRTGAKSQPARTPAIGLLALLLALHAAVTWGLTLLPATVPPRANADVFRLDDQLARAEVSVRSGGTTRACAWHSGDKRFTCSQDPWSFVGPYAGQTDGRALRCTWMHPQAGGAVTVLRWPDVQLGDRVRGRLALLDDVGPGADVHLRVFADDHPLLDATTAESRAVAEFEAQVPPGKPRAPLRVELSTADHAWRLACAELVMTGRRAPPPPRERAPHG